MPENDPNPTAHEGEEELPVPLVRALHEARTAADAVELAEARLAELRESYYDRVGEAIAVARSEGVKGAQAVTGRHLGISRQRVSELALRAEDRENSTTPEPVNA